MERLCEILTKSAVNTFGPLLKRETKEYRNSIIQKFIKEVEEALNEYNGTILFISHDRYFIDKVSQITFEIENEKITKYIGNYSDLKTQKKKVLEIGLQPKRR